MIKARIIGMLTLMGTTLAAANTVAITEFLNNAEGDDTGREFVELYNYGGSGVDLTDWMLHDEDSDSYTISATIGAGDFLILVGGDNSITGAAKKALFETEWLGGVPDARVIGMDQSWAFANGTDEILLSDDDSTVVWNLAYANDETTGRATFLTVDDYAVTDFGSKAAPGIDREGFDNGSPDFLGYESNDSALAEDPNAYESTELNWGSPFFIVDDTPPADLTLAISGTCPGSMTVDVTNATPNSTIAVLYAVNTGSLLIPGGNPCAGTELGLDTTTKLYSTETTDGTGSFTVGVTIPGPGCGLFVQILDVTSCETSNVDQL